MMKKLLVVCALFAVSALNAKTYKVNLFEDSTVGSTELAAGTYKLEIAGDKVRITNGKMTSEAAVEVKTAERKHASTTVRYTKENGKTRIAEIRLGGTDQSLVFN